jgi:hypothetical protein
MPAQQADETRGLKVMVPYFHRVEQRPLDLTSQPRASADSRIMPSRQCCRVPGVLWQRA